MPAPTILPPSGDLSPTPDIATKTGLDLTGPTAVNRILYINAGIIRYGTDDKAHAASIALSLLLLLTAIILMVVGLFASNTQWLEKMLSRVGSAFLFVAGVAIGGGGRDSPRDE